MIRHPELLESFERKQVKRGGKNYRANLRTYEALYAEARKLGIFPLKNPLEGIEVDLQLAKALHVRKTHHKNRKGS